MEIAEGQTVVSTGPYAVVRHPMYAGAILFLVGAPFALGSWWGFLFTLVFVGGLVWRLLNEEEFLCTNLLGYAADKREVPYASCRTSGSYVDRLKDRMRALPDRGAAVLKRIVAHPNPDVQIVAAALLAVDERFALATLERIADTLRAWLRSPPQ